MKKLNNSCDANNGEVPKQKERHIVSWSQEEDDILREQIRVHGTEKWYTYLNSDFKKGGWSPEEDMLLCEAQKIFGNRWTEIAKVVSGRTDNAVKNRFTTLCKKRAKHEALAKENNTTSYINLNNKRVIFPNGLNTDGGSENNTAPFKKLRTYISNQEENFAGECGIGNHLLRTPLAVLAQNASFDDTIAAANNKMQGTFLKKDDPKVIALIQQAELLSSLAIKVNSDKTEQSLESAWTVSDELVTRNSDDDFQLEKFKELLEDLRSGNEGSQHSWRAPPDMYESSPSSSEYSTGSTQLSCDKTAEQYQAEIGQLDGQHCLAEENGICHTESKNEEKNILTCNGIEAVNEELCDTEFNSPLHVTPLFRSLAAAIPSPKFSESVRILSFSSL
ncbi:hypothetical protein RD792_012514 [Penstemon davidsonii]|uniref:Uncharacterized protein n=1 Tax=Penstemon davidsonii TaxID=160366 RepID=A0ABR0CXG7_9LAMI|nr:hypothetical protein RD792_012514 [Penstemon davidsonii]